MHDQLADHTWNPQTRAGFVQPYLQRSTRHGAGCKRSKHPMGWDAVQLVLSNYLKPRLRLGAPSASWCHSFANRYF